MNRKFSAEAKGSFTRLSKKNFGIVFKAAVILITVSLTVWLLLRYAPYPDLERFMARPYSVRYYDRHGMLLQITPLEDGLRREKPAQIPAQIKDVFVFAEDKRFYRHIGVDAFALIRAVYQNVSGRRRVSGASTITMQLARIIADNCGPAAQPARSRTAGSKIAEMLNALRLETRFSKSRILEMYINSLPFGFSAQGAASASRNFFASEISMLSPAQVFCLAVIPRRPNHYNPHENPGNCMAAAMDLQSGFADNKRLARRWPLFAQIDERDFQFALSSAKRFRYPFEFPHLIRLINQQQKSAAGEMRLTVDLALQRYLENAIAGNVAMYFSSRVTNGSALVADNETGEILAWVGSADFFNVQAAGQIDGVLALNQPGSSMKPFLYAMALENGFFPSDVLSDVPMTFGESEIYFPQNFNNRFNGPMLFRASLASSLNIPAVYLLYRLSVRNYTQKLLDLGFDSVQKSAQEAGLGLALGNAPVSLYELVRAFSVFPRDGNYLDFSWEKGNKNTEHRVYSANAARIICSFLSDPGARVLAFGAGRNFRTSFPAIFKTGTANQYQSIVALGATMKYSAGVWMGNFTGETVMDKTGSSIPAVIVRDTLNVLHRAHSGVSPDFPQPDGWKIARICAVSGMDPGGACLSIINEYIHSGEKRAKCTWHKTVNGKSETIYPAEYQAWFISSVRQGSLDYSSRPLEIKNPRSGFVYLSGSGIGMDEIPVEVIGGGNDVLHVTHNGRSFDVARPFVFFLKREQGFNTLTVKNGYEEETITFTIER
ncbi:MAG: transglycosylase domain-containing protein [Treponema sp.]|jgi:penicillin-binding protein 1C|nr:transglycosylase domain-containing protein [Treponema sp.]